MQTYQKYSQRESADLLPPHSEETERGVLACLLLAPVNVDAMLEKLRRADFYELRHQTIFTAITHIAHAGWTLDTVLLVQTLGDKAELENAGGLEYVATLSDAAPSAANFPSYLSVLKDKAKRRELLALAVKAQEVAHDEKLDPSEMACEFVSLSEHVATRNADARTWITFYSPSQLREWQPPAGHILVGDCAIVRGGLAILAGAPGVGKSRGATALACAGVKGAGAEWLGLRVHTRFKSVILQRENGRYRLKQEFNEIDAPGLDDFVRVSDCPEFGLAFENPDFRKFLSNFLAEFKTDLLILDPWNAIARDDAIRDYRAALENIKDALPRGENMPAILIVAHTRKPKGDDRKIGRALLHELSGSYALGSAARAVFILQHASDDPADDRVVFTCAKNNDGSLGSPSAWQRRNGLFVPCDDFDWEEFERPANGGSAPISKEHLDALFQNGQRRLTRKTAIAELMEMTGLRKTACYNALALGGRFKDQLSEVGGLIAWTP